MDTLVASVVEEEETRHHEQLALRIKPLGNWREKAMHAHVTIRCMHCPDFHVEGEAVHCIEVQRQHLADEHGIERQPKIETDKRAKNHAALVEAFETFMPVVLEMLADGPVWKREIEEALIEQGAKRSHALKLLDALEARRVITRDGGVGGQSIYLELGPNAA